MASRAVAKRLRAMTEVAALILAAGKASRFRAAAGSDAPATKLVALLDGRALVAHVAAAALASRARPVIVVTGHAEAEVRAALADLPVRFVHNPDFADGMSTSLRTGIAALPATVDAAVVLLADMPRVTGPLVDTLIAAFAASPGTGAVVPLVEGRRGNPVLLSRALFAEVAKLRGDVGARPLLQSAGRNVVEVPVTDLAAAFDVDTPGGLSA